MSLISVSESQLNNYQGAETSLKLRIYCRRQFVSSDNETIMRGYVDSDDFYAELSCTVEEGVISIPAFDIDSTEDGTPGTSYYTFKFYSSAGDPVMVLHKRLVIPAAPSQTTLPALAVYNSANCECLPATYYTAAQIDALLEDLGTAPLATTVVYGRTRMNFAPATTGQPTAVENNWPPMRAARDTVYLEAYPNYDLEAAIADIGSDQVRLLITKENQYTADGDEITEGPLEIGKTYEIVTYSGPIQRLYFGNMYSGGTGIPNGLTTGVTLLGGSGNNAKADVYAVDGVATGVNISDGFEGNGYEVGDILTLDIGDNNCFVVVEQVFYDDFSNVGASFFDADSTLVPGNAAGVHFIATGTTPSVWTNGTVLREALTVPANIHLQFEGVGSLRAEGRNIYIKSMLNPGQVQVFTSDGNGKIIVDPRGVGELNLAWWAGQPTEVDDRFAFRQAEASMDFYKVGGSCYIPAGSWATDKVRMLTGSRWRGAGGHVDAIDTGTVLFPYDSSARFRGVVELQQQALNASLEDMSISASAVNIGHGNSATMQAFRYQAQGASSIGMRFKNVNFFSNYGYQMYTVAGAGTAGVNADYVVSGSANGKYYYNVVGGADSQTISVIIWSSNKWRIYDATGTLRYSSSEAVDTPSEVTAWSVDGGAGPAPTVETYLPEFDTVAPVFSNDGTGAWFESINWTFDHCTWSCGPRGVGIYWRTSNSGGLFLTPRMHANQGGRCVVAPVSGFMNWIDVDARGIPGYTIEESVHRTITGGTSPDRGGTATLGSNLLTLDENYVTAGAMFTNNDIGSYVICGTAFPDDGGDPEYKKFYIAGLNHSFEAVIAGGPNLNGEALANAGPHANVTIERLNDWTGPVAEAVFDIGYHILWNIKGGADEGFQYFIKDGAFDFKNTVNLYGYFPQSKILFDGGSSQLNLYGCTIYSNTLEVATGAPLARMFGGTVQRQLIRHDAVRYPNPNMKCIRGNAWIGTANQEDFIFDTSDKDADPADEGLFERFIVNQPARFIDKRSFGGPGESDPVVTIGSPTAEGGTRKILLALGQTHYYDRSIRHGYYFARDTDTGILWISGTQPAPYDGLHLTGSLYVEGDIETEAGFTVGTDFTVNGSIVLGSNADTEAFGYGTGCGGTVSQLTSNTTPVTINKKSGVITTYFDSIPAGGYAKFTVNNNTITLRDEIAVHVIHINGSTVKAFVEQVQNGSFVIVMQNYGAAPEAESRYITFAAQVRARVD